MTAPSPTSPVCGGPSPKEKGRLHGHTIWITGAARRIGRALALACAEQDARIIVHYNTSQDEAEETAELIHQQGSEAYLIQADLCSTDEIESAVSVVTARWPRIDGLIHNAAVFFPTPFRETTESDWDTTLDSNLKGPCFLTQVLLPTLLQTPKPSVIFMGDESTANPEPRLIPYAISKEGLCIFAAGLQKAYPTINVQFLRIGPTLPPEDSRLVTPDIIHSVDEVAQKVVSLL